ncbi:hypothetical protein [Halomarina ordinaria]|uniref:DUF2098 domain-containing protein n=1 Tax=Halomarina ordinaria TaxID=3033939 RepID=A0ABD5UGM2_9EURY|nr:hypothetical protein [Halomarina sp. PSRA2]
MDVGTAAITYETPEEDVVTERVDNERVAYVDDHWVLWDEADDGTGTVRRIPRERVHEVERSVDEVERKARDLLETATSKLG